MNYKYEVANMDVSGENNTVIQLHYRVSASKQGCDLIPVRSGVVRLNEPGDPFIPFDQITKELAIEWLKQKIDCQAIEQDLAQDIENFVPEVEIESSSKLPSSWN
jgi:hypothetical protein